MPPLVYLVDDDHMLALSFQALLAAEGIAFEHFESAERLLDAIGTLAPGCIVMDIYMAGADGISALQALKERGIDWPTIIMSGTAEDNDEHLAWACGAIDFLHKPFHPGEIMGSIRNALHQLSAANGSSRLAEDAVSGGVSRQVQEG